MAGADQGALPTTTMRTAGADASTEQDYEHNWQDGAPSDDKARASGDQWKGKAGNVRGAERSDTNAAAAASIAADGRACGHGTVLLEGFKVLQTGVTVDVVAARQAGGQPGADSAADPNSAVPNSAMSANVKIVQRMYSDTGDSPKPNEGQREGSPESINEESKLRAGEALHPNESQGSKEPSKAGHPGKLLHLLGARPQDSIASQAEMQAATTQTDLHAMNNAINEEVAVHQKPHAAAVGLQNLKASDGPSLGGHQPHKGGTALPEKQRATGTTKGVPVAQPARAVIHAEITPQRGQHAGENSTNADLISYSWMNAQNRVFEDFIAQTSGTNQQQYQPIQSKIQKLTGNTIGLNVNSQGLKTPAEISLFNNQHKYRVAKLPGAQQAAAADPAGGLPASASPTSRQWPAASTSEQAHQSEL